MPYAQSVGDSAQTSIWKQNFQAASGKEYSKFGYCFFFKKTRFFFFVMENFFHTLNVMTTFVYRYVLGLTTAHSAQKRIAQGTELQVRQSFIIMRRCKMVCSNSAVSKISAKGPHMFQKHNKCLPSSSRCYQEPSKHL